MKKVFLGKKFIGFDTGYRKISIDGHTDLALVLVENGNSYWIAKNGRYNQCIEKGYNVKYGLKYYWFMMPSIRIENKKRLNIE